MIYQDYLDHHELRRYASTMNSRAKQVNAKGILTADLLRDRIFESAGRCEWCGTNLVKQPFELDHVESLSRNGSNTADNLVVACPDCNRRKSGKHPARFASEIYSETGYKSRLLEKIIQRYEITPKTQMTLFDNKSILPETKIEHDDDSSSVPPYKWS